MLHIDAAIVLLPRKDERSHTCQHSQTTEMLNRQVHHGMSRTGSWLHLGLWD